MHAKITHVAILGQALPSSSARMGLDFSLKVLAYKIPALIVTHESRSANHRGKIGQFGRVFKEPLVKFVPFACGNLGKPEAR